MMYPNGKSEKIEEKEPVQYSVRGSLSLRGIPLTSAAILKTSPTVFIVNAAGPPDFDYNHCKNIC